MDRAISPAALSRLIGAIYDCALEPGRWPATMEAICRELDLRTGAISLISLPDGEPLLAASTGFEDPWLDKVSFYGAELVELWGGDAVIRSLPLDEPAVLSRVNPAVLAADSTDRFHVEFNRPQGFIDAIAVGLTRDTASIGTIGFNRHESAGPLGEREIAVVRLLVPHLQRAAAISRLLEARSMAATTFEAALDMLTIPVIFLGEDLSVVHINRPAQAMVREGAPVRLRNGRLTSRSLGVEAALAVAIAQAGDDESALGRKGLGIPVPDEEGAGCVIHVFPLRQRSLRPGIAPSAVAAIFFAAASAPPQAPLEAVAALFGLTEAETRVFQHLAGGLTIAETAERLGVAVSTVRTHLLRLFDKTGVHRQAELVALSASLSVPAAC